MGLLIGLNCPSALLPREIVYGGESDPYTVRSLLGWYINVPLYTPCESSILTCNRIHLNQQDTSSPRGYVVFQRTVKEQITPQAVERMFELDFSEKEKGISMSREDIKFYETVELVSFISRTCTMKCPSLSNIGTLSSQTTMLKLRSA